MKKRYLKILAILLVQVLLCLDAAHAQQRQHIFSGRVLDATTRQPIPGVGIIDVATKKGIGVTDAKGDFSVQVNEGESVAFRYIGFKEITVKTTRTHINISMTPENKALKETVIVGYQTRSKETVTGAVAVISGKDIQDAPAANVEQLLQGKVAGLMVQNNTGAPGFAGSVAIRGVSQLNITGSGDQSFLASSSPLLVIDNVPVSYDGGINQSMLQPGAATGPLALIPPDDIESIEVLKDAQATSLYGSRGANGVIIITTKKGNSPTPIIDVNGSVYISYPPALRPTWGGNLERWFRINSILNGSQNSIVAKNTLSNAQFLTDSLNSFYNNSTNWQALFYQTTVNTNNSVQISGGNLALNYKANLAYQMNQGVIKNTGFNTYSMNLQLNIQPSERLRISTQLFSALGQKQRGNGGGLTGNGAGNAFTSSLLPGPSHFVNIPQFAGYLNNLDANNTVNIRGYVDLDYEFIHNFRINSTTSYDYYTDTRDRFNNAFANNNQTSLYGFVGHRDELNSRNGINYNYSTDPSNIENGHNFFASVFSEINVQTNNQHIRDVANGPSDFYWGPRGYSPRFYPGNVWDDPNGINDNGTPVSTTYHAASWAAAFSYNYKTKYNLDLSYRLDGNSSAGVNNPYTVNPSIGFRWNFSKENLLNKLTWLDYSDIRMTYGLNSRAASTVQNTLGSYISYPSYNNSPAIAPDFNVLPNPSIGPEKSYQYDFGGDLSVFKGRLSLTYDTYFKYTFNLIRNLNLSNTTGYNYVQVNGAAIVNYGHELTVIIRPIVSANQKDFQWTINVNGAYNRGVLTRLPGDAQLYLQSQNAPTWQSFALKVGREPISNYLYQTLGVYKSTADVPVDPIRGVRYKSFRGSGNQYFQAGDPIWRDINGDYALDGADDYIITGNPADPNLNGGLTNTFSYRNFSLNIFCSYLSGRDILNNALAGRIYRLLFPDQLSISGTAAGPVNVFNLGQLDYWTPSSTNAKYPAISDIYHANQILPYRLDQTLFQENGAYFKVNQVTLAYQFQNFGFMKRWGLRLLRAYATAFNIGTFSPYSGPNPETVTNLGRDDIGGYPAAFSLSFGFNAEF